MKAVLDLPITKGDKVWTIISTKSNKAEAWYVKEIHLEAANSYDITNDKELRRDFQNSIYLILDRYNNGTDSCTIKVWLSACFLTKEELLESL